MASNQLNTQERAALRIAKKEGSVRPSVLGRALNKGGEQKVTTAGWLAYNAIMSLKEKGLVKRSGRGQYVLTNKGKVA